MPANKSWHDYNESLIERGRVLIDLDFIRSSNEEINNMNKDKVGAPFQYSDNYIQFLAFLKIGFKIPYRTVQGIVRVDYRGLRKKNWRDTLYTYHRRRIIKIKPSVGGNLDFQDDDPITLIVDASGLTISKKGDYI